MLIHLQSTDVDDHRNGIFLSPTTVDFNSITSNQLPHYTDLIMFFTPTTVTTIEDGKSPNKGSLANIIQLKRSHRRREYKDEENQARIRSWMPLAPDSAAAN